MGLAPGEKVFDCVFQGGAESDFGAQGGAEGDGEFLEFETEAGVGFEGEGRVAVEEVPDLDEEFACDPGDGDVYGAQQHGPLLELLL